MKKTLLLLLSVGLSVLGACSDDDNSSNPSGEKIYPTTAGSYWIYKNYMTDSNDVEVFTGEIDSTVCLGTETYMGKSAVALMHYYTLDGVESDSEKSYFYEDNSKIYMPSGDFTSDSPLGDGENLFTARWMKVYDGNEDGWIVFDTNFTNLSIMDNVEFTGSLTISGKKSSNVTFQIKDTSISAKHAIIKVQFSGKVKYNGNTFPMDIVITQYNHAYIAPNIGLLAMVTDPTVIPFLGTSPGTASRLIRYLIK